MLLFFFTGCIEQIRLHAETGTETYSESTSPHILELSVSGKPVSVAIPCDKHGFCDLGEVNEFDYDIVEFFRERSVPSCIHHEDITSASLKQGGNNGWLVKSVFTSYVTECGRVLPLTSDRVFNKWVDGDEDPSYLEQELTLV